RGRRLDDRTHLRRREDVDRKKRDDDHGRDCPGFPVHPVHHNGFAAPADGGAGSRNNVFTCSVRFKVWPSRETRPRRSTMMNWLESSSRLIRRRACSYVPSTLNEMPTSVAPIGVRRRAPVGVVATFVDEVILFAPIEFWSNAIELGTMPLAVA